MSETSIADMPLYTNLDRIAGTIGSWDRRQRVDPARAAI
jgi:hypothetical protein